VVLPPTAALPLLGLLSCSIEAKEGLKEDAPPIPERVVVMVGGLPASVDEPYLDYDIPEGGRRLPPMPGFSLSCLLSQVII
jgi:hypothetical protein